jgi:hypothetical protein
LNTRNPNAKSKPSDTEAAADAFRAHPSAEGIRISRPTTTQDPDSWALRVDLSARVKVVSYDYAPIDAFRGASSILRSARRNKRCGYKPQFWIYGVSTKIDQSDIETSVRRSWNLLGDDSSRPSVTDRVVTERSDFVLGLFVAERCTELDLSQWLTSAADLLQDRSMSVVEPESRNRVHVDEANEQAPPLPRLGQSVDSILEAAEAECDRLQARLQTSIAEQLTELRDRGELGFLTSDEKAAFARRLQALLERVGLRLHCPNCGRTGLLLGGAPYGPAGVGGFRFDHLLIEGRRQRCGSFESLEVVRSFELSPAPPKKSRKYRR